MPDNDQSSYVVDSPPLNYSDHVHLIPEMLERIEKLEEEVQNLWTALSEKLKNNE